MRPLDAIAEQSSIATLLQGAAPDEVRAELSRLQQLELPAAQAGARRYAEGALALREGRLNDAYAAFDEAAAGFAAQAQAEAAALSRCEAWLASIRRGPRSVYPQAIAALEQLAEEHPDSRAVQVTARHYHGTALRYSGRAEATLRVLLDAFAASDGLLAERAQVLNSLGTLYVVLGAYGAANAVLEHAAELNHQLGDKVGEAISYGQLGSAALARGELLAAKTYLQKQEWLASRVGDVFGQSRALVLLGDLAIDLKRPDDAIEFAELARRLASSVQPPLGMWLAYATRTIGRAKLELGDPAATGELESALERFRKLGNQLGEAFVEWDLAHAGAQAAGPDTTAALSPRWHRSAWSLAGLGLTGRVAQVLRDLRELAGTPGSAPKLDLALAAVAQQYPHLAAAHEVELVYSEPDTLAVIATRRIEGQRNLGRIAALMLAGTGLYLGVAASEAIGRSRHALPSIRAGAALVGQLPGVAVWAWAAGSSGAEIARDLSSLRTASGEDTRAVLSWFSEAKVAATPFAGESGALLEGVALAPLVALAAGAAAGSLQRSADVPWDGEAEALARMGGYDPSTIIA